MSIEVDRATLSCTACGAMVHELRRGRCWGCYSKWAEQRTVPKGASCAICHERRRAFLRSTELHSRWVTLCHNCAARTHKLTQIPQTLDGLRALLGRERRSNDRRGDGLERRIFPRERRVGDRRGPPRSASGDTNPNIQMPVFDDIEIEIRDEDIEMVEQTLVRAVPTR